MYRLSHLVSLRACCFVFMYVRGSMLKMFCYPVADTVVYNHWTGMVEWNSGLWGERSLLMQFSIKVLQLKYVTC